MAKFSKIEVISAMASTGMVPVFYNKDIEISKNVLKACYDGGVRAFEFTNRGDLAHEVFCDLIKFVLGYCISFEFSIKVLRCLINPTCKL